MRRLLFWDRAGGGSTFHRCESHPKQHSGAANTQVEAPESTSVLNHQTSGPGDVKFTFSVYLACLWHSTTRLRSPFQQDAKLQQTWEKHFGCSRVTIAIITLHHSLARKISVNNQTQAHCADLKLTITLSFLVPQSLSHLIGRSRICI